MSKAEVLNVATLAAHLALKDAETVSPHTDLSSPRSHAGSYAADALELQKLGRRAQRNEAKRCNVRDYYRETPHGLPTHDCAYQLEAERIGNVAFDLLKPYGLSASVGGDPRGYCLHIRGLPGNTLGGDADGYGI